MWPAWTMTSFGNPVVSGSLEARAGFERVMHAAMAITMPAAAPDVTTAASAPVASAIALPTFAASSSTRTYVPAIAAIAWAASAGIAAAPLTVIGPLAFTTLRRLSASITGLRYPGGI